MTVGPLLHHSLSDSGLQSMLHGQKILQAKCVWTNFLLSTEGQYRKRATTSDSQLVSQTVLAWPWISAPAKFHLKHLKIWQQLSIDYP